MRTYFIFIALLFPVLALAQPAKKKSATLTTVGSGTADQDKQTLIRALDNRFVEYADLSKQIWDFAELGFLEDRSSALLENLLQKEGFQVTKGVAGIPTAFVASFGSGKPVIGLLGEYDALAGLATEATPESRPIPGQRGGHGCGHNLFGVASVAAAIEVKNWLARSGHPGTIKFYGCPAEEGGFAKVYMIREGFFNDVDAVLHWHPEDHNTADPVTSLASIGGRFRFTGIASHAAAAPERGRSALDGVEAMDYMINMMREHIPSDARIHYIITKGGDAPNIVPANAEVYCYARHKDIATLQSIWKRIENAAEGAAKGTGTQVRWEIEGGVYNKLPIVSLAEVMYKNLQTVGGVPYTPEETAFARKLSQTFSSSNEPIENAATVDSFHNGPEGDGGSSDVGDVSYVVPTAGLFTATWVPGSSAHTWQSTAASGMSIGQKGMLVAAKTLSMTALDLYKTPALLKKAHAEWRQKLGPDFVYKALIGNRPPPLDYRK